jgi:serine/threonine protein kinase
LIKEPVNGWFKLLNAEEGEFYNIRIPPEDEEGLERLQKKMADLHGPKATKDAAKPVQTPPAAPKRATPPIANATSNNCQNEVIKASDFSFITVLGKGSFGKVLLAEHKNNKVKILKKSIIQYITIKRTIR